MVIYYSAVEDDPMVLKIGFWGRRYATLLSIALFLPTSALAECNGSQNLRSEQFYIQFEENVHDLSGSEAVRLAKWVATMNARYTIQDFVTVGGSASEREKNPKALAMKRAVSVARAALQDGLTIAPLQVKAQVYPLKDFSVAKPETREVGVEISPGCPNRCCDGT